MKIEIIPCLKDNYAYVIIDENNKKTCVVDPSESEPIINFLEIKVFQNLQLFVKVAYKTFLFSLELQHQKFHLLYAGETLKNFFQNHYNAQKGKKRNYPFSLPLN